MEPYYLLEPNDMPKDTISTNEETWRDEIASLKIKYGPDALLLINEVENLISKYAKSQKHERNKQKSLIVCIEIH